MKKYDFRLFDRGDYCWREDIKQYEHSLHIDNCGDGWFEYCYRCGMAWNLTDKEAKEIWGI